MLCSAQMLVGKAMELNASAAWQHRKHEILKQVCATAVGSHSACRLNMGVHHADVPHVSVLRGQYEPWRSSPDQVLVQLQG